MKSRVIPYLVFVVLALGPLTACLWILSPGATPTVHFAGTSPDGLQLLFEIRNSSSKEWNFGGYYYVLPSNFRQFVATTPSGATPGYFNLIPPRSQLAFAVTRPVDGSEFINAGLWLGPGSRSKKQVLLAGYSNKLRALINLPASDGWVLQQSGAVKLTPLL